MSEPGYCEKLVQSLRMEASAASLAMPDSPGRELWRQGMEILSRKLNAAADLLEEQFARITDLELANGVKAGEIERLRKLFLKWCRHTSDCRRLGPDQCTCGFKAAVRGLEGP
jgi:hypothetical protein